MPGDGVAFWHALAKQPLARNDHGFRALLLYFAGGDRAPDYANRVANLKSRGWLPPGFREPADRALRRGDLAYALAHAMGIKGGPNMRLFPGPRYALRELEFLELMPQSSPNQVLTGLELVGIISKVQDYRTTGTTDPSGVAPKAGHTLALAPPSIDDNVADLPSAAELTLVRPVLASASQDPATAAVTAPATAPAGGGVQPLSAVVQTVEGEARWTQVGSPDWRPVRKDEVLGEDTILETGPDGKVVLRASDNAQLMTVYHLSAVSLLELRQQGGVAKTDIGVDYGRVEYEIYAPGTLYDATVRAPNDILAVRSTRVILYEQPPFVPMAISLHGRAEFSRKRFGDVVALGAAAPRRVRVAANREGAAQTALPATVVDPTIADARTPSEERLVDYLLARGATVTLEGSSPIPVARGGGPFDSRRFAADTFPDTGLRFIVTWENVRGQPNLDVRLKTDDGVFAPTPDVFFTTNSVNIPFDHRGGKHGGVELVVFPNDFAPGNYTFGVATDKGAAKATFQAYVGRNSLPISQNQDDLLPGFSGDIVKDVDVNESKSPFVIVDVPSAFAPGEPADVGSSSRTRRARGSPTAPAPAAAPRRPDTARQHR